MASVIIRHHSPGAEERPLALKTRRSNRAIGKVPLRVAPA
jgi:hypothetical protein